VFHLLWILPLSGLAVLWLRARGFDRRIRFLLARCRQREGGAEEPRGRSAPELLERFAAATCGAPGPDLRFVALEQAGEMRRSPDGPWLPFRATQVFAVDRVEFAWVARFRMPPGLPLRVVDAVGPDGGFLEARLLDAIRVARARGPATTRAQLMRYLAELAWCPPAVRENPQLSFEARDALSLRARCAQDGITAHVDLVFDEAADLVEARGLRPRDTADGPIDTPWFGTFSDHRPTGGLRVPRRGEAGWLIDGEEFVYWRAQITALTIG
jgi:hypothetical protein